MNRRQPCDKVRVHRSRSHELPKVENQNSSCNAAALWTCAIRTYCLVDMCHTDMWILFDLIRSNPLKDYTHGIQAMQLQDRLKRLTPFRGWGLGWEWWWWWRRRGRADPEHHI